VGWIPTGAGPVIIIDGTPHTTGTHEMVVVCCFYRLVYNVLTQPALQIREGNGCRFRKSGDVQWGVSRVAGRADGEYMLM